MVKYLFIFACCFSALAQETFVQPGLLRATATISPAWGVATGPNNIYLNGELEAFLTNRNSIRGDVFALVGTESAWENLRHNHSLLIGPAWHLTRHRWDLFSGFEMGITYTSFVNPTPTTFHKSSIHPAFSGLVGVHYYVHSYFHFFATVRYLHNLYRGHMAGTQNWSELVLSAGLGFQIQTKRK